jgi:GNAT superfamily N-acetyltransferase
MTLSVPASPHNNALERSSQYRGRAIIERAGDADIPALVELMSQFYAESSYALDREWAAASFAQLLQDEARGAVWIARRGTEAAGHIVLVLRHSMEFGGSTGVIDDLFVRPQFRRQGVGSANIKRACVAAAVLSPMAAHGSFGGAPCRDDFACHFVTWGILVGTVGVPISGLIFAVLHLGLCNRARSKLNQFFLGGFIGMVAYEISAACAALMGAWGKATIGHHEDYPLIGFASAYVVSAIVSVLYARSSPRHPRGEGGDV